MSNATQGQVKPLPRLEIRDLARLGAAILLAVGLTGLPAVTGALGQAKGKGEEAEAKGGAANQRAYSAGVRAFESGDMATAEKQLTTALSGGGLPSAQMARALYFRGSASRRLGKPAQAISDLTTAVWLKGGLSDAERAKATEERQLAYREAGLGDTPPPIGAAPLDQSPTTPKPGAAPQAKPGTQVAVVGPSSFWNNMSMPSLPTIAIPGMSSSATPAQQSAAQPAAAPVAEVAVAAPAPPAAEAQAPAAAPVAAPAATAGAQTSAWATETAPAAAPAPPQQISTGFAPEATPVSTGLNAMPGASPAGEGSLGGGSTWSNPLAGTGAAVGGFFSNMFGSSSEAASDAAVTTGSTAAAASEWGSDTTVVNAQTSSMVQRGPDSPSALPWSASGGPSAGGAAQGAAAQKAPAKKVAAKTGGGNFKLQVASVRSREEADKLAQTLQGYPAVRSGAVRTEVDEAVIGSMGTFYRVRLGPYANAKEPGDLCQTLKPQGFDCLVVTQ
ncbi:SPOR domain-containing protein [Hyphomicrobium nitrativorans]|uniref:SPOR domain-containing protein n=1 Tax=Hyphomicrobium nitrativorans TaxID=1427356 RepID=UPI001182D53E|nr:SPOR domain-containing protein [Hyphomicrobium nitrativorans]